MNAEVAEKKVGQMYRESIIDVLDKGFEENQNIFLMSYSQLDGNVLNDFRKQLLGAGANVTVSKNSLARIALKNKKQEKLAELVSGQTAFVWSNSDSVEVSKIIVKFSKDLDNVTVQGGILGDKELLEADVVRLSDLPSKQTLQAQLLGTISAPVTRLLGAFNAKSRDLLSILKQLSEQKGGN